MQNEEKRDKKIKVLCIVNKIVICECAWANS